MKTLRICLVFLATCVWGSGTACAQSGSIPPEALSLALQAVYEKPGGMNAASFQPTIVMADGLPRLGRVTVFGSDAVVRTRAEAREAQLAWFVYLERSETTPDGWLIEYQQPSGARFGSVRVKREGEGWVLGELEKMRSSSGARLFYGELYQDEKCRPGSEMARRWAMQRDATGAAGAGAASSEGVPASCPGEEFPEVAAYRQAKRLGLIR